MPSSLVFSLSMLCSVVDDWFVLWSPIISVLKGRHAVASILQHSTGPEVNTCEPGPRLQSRPLVAHYPQAREAMPQTEH